MTRIDDTARDRWLAAHVAWRHDPVRGAITREFGFADFVQAFAFMTALALRAQARNHHPEWGNVGSRVTVTWTTHDVDGLSPLDVEMAQFSDATACALGAA